MVSGAGRAPSALPMGAWARNQRVQLPPTINVALLRLGIGGKPDIATWASNSYTSRPLLVGSPRPLDRPAALV
jgi:hypothetical protein